MPPFAAATFLLQRMRWLKSRWNQGLPRLLTDPPAEYVVGWFVSSSTRVVRTGRNPSAKGRSPMRKAALVSTGAAALIAITLFSTASVDARRGGGGISRGGGHSMGRASHVAHRAPTMRRAPSHSGQRVHHQQGQRKHVASGKKAQSAQRKHNKAAATTRKQHQQKQAGSTKRNIAAGGALAAGAIAGKGAARNLPVSKAVAGGASINGRVAVPKNLRPRLTVIRPPHVGFRPRLAPFVQRHWRHPFFWAAVAGVGYLTVPDLYYDRFYGCVNADDPDYGCAVDLLSSAALDEELGTTRVRYPMPSTAAYRYSANVAPKSEAGLLQL